MLAPVPALRAFAREHQLRAPGRTIDSIFDELELEGQYEFDGRPFVGVMELGGCGYIGVHPDSEFTPS